MKWRFADLYTLREVETGYEIHLEGGTWFHPKKLRPRAPEGMEYSIRLKILRGGLQHIKSIGGDTNDKPSPFEITAA